MITQKQIFGADLYHAYLSCTLDRCVPGEPRSHTAAHPSTDPLTQQPQQPHPARRNVRWSDGAGMVHWRGERSMGSLPLHSCLNRTFSPAG